MHGLASTPATDERVDVAEGDRPTGSEGRIRQCRGLVAALAYAVLLGLVISVGSIAVVRVGTAWSPTPGLGGILVVWVGVVGLAAVAPIVARRAVHEIGLATTGG